MWNCSYFACYHPVSDGICGENCLILNPTNYRVLPRIDALCYRSIESQLPCLLWVMGHDWMWTTMPRQYLHSIKTDIGLRILMEYSRRGGDVISASNIWFGRSRRLYFKAFLLPITSVVFVNVSGLVFLKLHFIMISTTYSISQEICKRFCCALLCCGYVIVHNEFKWSIYPYSSGLLCWHWGNRQM